MTLLERFWEKVEFIPGCECWIWNAAVDTPGYGRLNIGNGHLEGAHRLSWQFHFGPIPVGLWVLHKCDVKCCVRPIHLYLGTNKKNIQDCVMRGQFPPAKIDAQKAKEIREMYMGGGVTQSDLARIYGINQPHISRIVRRECWYYI